MTDQRSSAENRIAWIALDETAPLPPDVLKRRLHLILAGFLLGLLIIESRLVQLEARDGQAFRAAAAEPIVRERSVPGLRGRILARDGEVLAADEPLSSLAVAYRWLEEPPNPRWLRTTARRRLPPGERRDAEKLAAAEGQLLVEREAMHAELAALCGVSPQQWAARRAAVQREVTALARRVHERRQAEFAEQLAAAEAAEQPAEDWTGSVREWLEELFDTGPPSPPGAIAVAEELTPHVLADRAPLEVVALVQAQPERFPGVKILDSVRRNYPQAATAAHAIGYIGRPDRAELAARNPAWLGRTGIERYYEQHLAARSGLSLDLCDRAGRVKSAQIKRAPQNGRDLTLTLDLPVQRFAESALDAALAARLPGENVDVENAEDDDADDAAPQSDLASGGGAVLVIDIHTGAILAAASAPRFDPNVFLGSDDGAVSRLLADAAHPLLDRTLQMALPPGSVFKTVTAAALLESETVTPEATMICRGYLNSPDRLRCAIYRRQGVGHGQLALAEALAASCNVYFFQHAAEAGPAPLLAYARRFGFGAATGVDLPGEAFGNLPTPRNLGTAQRWTNDDTRATAIGQGRLTATPLQVVRMIAAIGNGGKLVTPHLVERDDSSISQGEPIKGLKAETLVAIRAGLRRAVDDEIGTAHALGQSPRVTLAGKTGTAETGTDRDHAWFAGYAPAERPRVAFVVVLEHGGNAGATAVPVARRLVEQMYLRGLLGPVEVAREPSFPTGKG